MAATGIGNPAGAVQYNSWEPRVITAKARTNVSGGVLVFASGATGVVSSGLNSVAWSDIEVAIDASGGQFTGIALQSIASGNAVPVALEGVFLLQANSTIVAGTNVGCDGNNAIIALGSETMVASTVAGKGIGRALTAAASGGFALVHVK